MISQALFTESLHQKVHTSLWHVRLKSQLFAGGRVALERALHLPCSVQVQHRAAAVAGTVRA